ncbi:MAG: hypothetical protein DKINENOH_04388 [bacterium]|nr:hypothetical protein [bacterium]MCK6560008.1 hypothetical protein [bacterium]NUM66618.1 hypothetical protein [candidate division KSB1 bacterium]
MKAHRFGVVLTLMNLVLLVLLMAQNLSARAQNIAPVLRGRALEIVDSSGRVRASITVEPAVTIDSRTYPETVVLRLTDPHSGPLVKITATEAGSALGLSDDADGGVEVASTKHRGNFVKIVSREGREQIIKP